MDTISRAASSAVCQEPHPALYCDYYLESHQFLNLSSKLVAHRSSSWSGGGSSSSAGGSSRSSSGGSSSSAECLSFSDGGSSCRSSISDGDGETAFLGYNSSMNGPSSGSGNSKKLLRRQLSRSISRRLPGQLMSVTHQLGLEVAPQLLLSGASVVAGHCIAAGCAAAAGSMSSGGSVLGVIKEEVLESIREDAPLHVTLE